MANQNEISCNLRIIQPPVKELDSEDFYEMSAATKRARSRVLNAAASTLAAHGPGEPRVCRRHSLGPCASCALLFLLLGLTSAWGQHDSNDRAMEAAEGRASCHGPSNL